MEVPQCDYYQVHTSPHLAEQKNLKSNENLKKHTNAQQPQSQTTMAVMKKSITNRMNHRMPSTLTDHVETIDVRAKFKNCVRRLLVLNKGKEGRKLKIVELIEFIRSQK